MPTKRQNAAQKAACMENMKKAHTPEAKAKQVASRKMNASIKAAVYDELKNALLTGTDNSTYYKSFIDNFLKVAKKDPNSRCGQVVAQTIFQQEMLSLLDEQHEAEMNKDRDFQRYRLLKDFFDHQRGVIMETNHRKRLLVCCSRRAGKTDLASGAINYAAIIPDSRIIYINLTFTNAINQIWNNTLQRAEECGLTISKSSKAEGTIEFSNGSSVRIMGNSNNAEIEKLRGESKVSLVIIDEFFHQRNMQYAIDEVISPLLADREDSTILCMGTPPRLAKTYGEKCWNESGWRKYHWTMFDNPYMPNPQEYLDDLCKNKGITSECPYIQREYYGKIGVYDIEALVFKNRQTFNKYDNNSPITNAVIGIDYGSRDYNAVVTVVYNKHTKKAWVLKEDKFNRSGVQDLIKVVKEHYAFASDMVKLNNLVPEETVTIYADTSDEQITYDLFVREKLPAYNAYKYNKAYAIEMLSDALRTGAMLIRHNGIIDEEMEQVLYKRDEDDTIINELDEEIGIHPDITMALLYASRKIFQDWGWEDRHEDKHPALEGKAFKVTDDGLIRESFYVEDDTVGENIGIVGGN